MSKFTPGYEITEDGKVFSIFHNWRGYGKRKMTQYTNKYGYLYVRLTIDGIRKKYLVHQLVAHQFIGNRPSPNHEVRHLNGIKTDNRSINLAWGTRKENASDRAIHGHTSHGLSHSMAIKKGQQNSTNPYWRHAR